MASNISGHSVTSLVPGLMKQRRHEFSKFDIVEVRLAYFSKKSRHPSNKNQKSNEAIEHQQYQLAFLLYQN